jgi:hypothetical protein
VALSQSLPAAAGIEIDGSGSEHLGLAGSSAGDFNGDGYSDVVLGSFSRAYVVLGAANTDWCPQDAARGNRGFELADSVPCRGEEATSVALLTELGLSRSSIRRSSPQLRR